MVRRTRRRPVNKAHLVRSALAQRAAHVAGLNASHQTLKSLGFSVGRTIIGRVARSAIPAIVAAV